MSSHRERAARAAFAACLGLAAAARAGPDLSATTYFDTRPYARDGQSRVEAPIFESLTLVTPAIDSGRGIDDVRVVLRAWGRLNAGEAIDGSRSTGDVDVAYVEGRALGKHLLLRVGRQLVSEGAARNLQLDGASTTISFLPEVGLQLYGGVPVTERFGYSRGDFASGGRFFLRPTFGSEVGLSFIYALDAGELARNDLAWDGRIALMRNLSVALGGAFSLVESRVAEARARLTWEPLRELEVSADAQRTAPDLFLSRTSIFSVFSSESRDELGGEVATRVGRVSASADFHEIFLVAGNGQRAGARGSVHLGRERNTSVGCELRVLEEPGNGYQQVRVFVMHLFPGLGLRGTLEGDGYRLDEAVNGVRHSIVGNATLGYALSPAWDATVGGSVGQTPYLDRRVELAARLTWRPGARP